MWWLLSLTVAQGAVPEGVRPAVAPVDIQARYDQYRSGKNLPLVPLACEAPIADAVRLCFKFWEGEKRRWVSLADLNAWGVSLADLHQALVPAATQALEGLQSVAIAGTERHYLQLADGDGWAAAGLLAPHVLASKAPRPLMAMPQTSVMVSWSMGDAETDLIMAVGVKEMKSAARDPVSAMVLRWDGKQWIAFAEAEKKTGPTP
ncbi:MAG: hypothetical protein GWP91_00525 [Rhodobacterales bacterium]|nr:hypothetical protein [Rhodobacterales bacterium]